MHRASNSLNESTDARILTLRFGPFELDVRSGELRRNGTTVRLQPQPLKVLLLLAGRPGEVVTREEIQSEIWPAGTFVDFEQSLNFCIRQIRAALRDDANAPRYIETLPRRGYRWVAGPVQSESAPAVVREWPRPLASDAAPGLAGDSSGSVPAATGARRRIAPWLALAVVAALGLAAAALWLSGRERPAAEAPSFQRITFRRGAISSARFAPDGQVVYSAAWDGGPRTLHVVRSDPRDSSEIGIPNVMAIVGVSPSGEVAFLRSGVLARAPLAGGPPKEVLQKVAAADWDAAGRDFAVARYDGDSFKIEHPAGRVLAETTARPVRLRISPDGRHVAFTEHAVLSDDRGSVVILDGSGRTVARSPEWASLEGLAWAPDGSEVLFTASEAGADNSLRALTPAGRVRVVLSSTGRLVLHDIAPDGRVLLERATARTEVLFRRASDREDRELSWLDYSAVVGISPSGDRILFYESGEGGGPEYATFLRGTDGSTPVRVGPGRALDLSADGQLVLTVDLRNATHIDVTPTGPGEIRSMQLRGLVAHEDAGFLSDSRRIFVTGRDAAGRRATWLTDIEGRDPRELPLPEGRILRHNTFSRDGAHFVASCPEGGGCCRYDTREGRPAPIPGTQKEWMAVGVDTRDRLYFREDRAGRPARLLRFDPKSGQATPLAELAPRDRAGSYGVLTLAVAADGEAWAYTFLRRLSDLHVVTGVTFNP